MEKIPKRVRQRSPLMLGYLRSAHDCTIKVMDIIFLFGFPESACEVMTVSPASWCFVAAEAARPPSMLGKHKLRKVSSA
jgi:hypothetical protein